MPSSWLEDGEQFRYDEMGSSTLYQLNEVQVPTDTDGAQEHGEHALSRPPAPPLHQHQHQHQSTIYSAQGLSSHGSFGTYNPHDAWGFNTPTSNQQRIQTAGMAAAAAQYPDDIDRSRWHEAQPPKDLSYSPAFSDSPIISSIGHRGVRRTSDLDSLFEDSSDLGDEEDQVLMMHVAAGVVHDSPADVGALPSDHNHHDGDSFEQPSPCGLSQQLQGQLNVLSSSETGVELVQLVHGQGRCDMDDQLQERRPYPETRSGSLHNCPCGCATAECACHPAYCECSGCDHTEQARQLKSEAENKWGFGGEADNQGCGGGDSQKKPCSCLPGLCRCETCAEHTGEMVPEPVNRCACAIKGRKIECDASKELELGQRQEAESQPVDGGVPSQTQAWKQGESFAGGSQTVPEVHTPQPCRSENETDQRALHGEEAVKVIRTPTLVSRQDHRPLHLKLAELIESPIPVSSSPQGSAGVYSRKGSVPPTIQQPTTPAFSQRSSMPPSRPDTPRPPVDSTPSTPYAADVLQDYVQQSIEQRLPPPAPAPEQDQIRQSVEPELPPPNWARESTPAYVDRSLTPSPLSRRDNTDVEMKDISPTLLPGDFGLELSLPPPTSEPSVSAPTRPAPPPIPDGGVVIIKQPKRGERRKSAVHGAKVEKRSATGSPAKPKSRNVTRKPTASVGKLVEKAKRKTREAAAEAAEGGGTGPEQVQGASLRHPLLSNKKAAEHGGKVAAAVERIERHVKQQDEEQSLTQKDGTAVRRSRRANKGVRTSFGYT
ncbi:hypothetical protein AYO20_09264 [Fonsecaea nubica]|uniref:Uncharacterized protein n=1 Tax=Fonsecaea nubica TaxID=856822 RepID=A0A178CKD4_9EURO|nr:hypothetical protein AYO20_09264 [Fonsecaea nubica]OAL29211.1 hypothetical protein AYO20_09264 [Fonsecaea nubica]